MASDFRIIRNADTGTVVIPRAKWCASFLCKLRGLMFRSDLPADEALLFIYPRESRIDTSIHMFFMGFAIATIWLDKEGRVVDKTLAKPWRPAYAPRVPAQYIIEAHVSLLDQVNVGDRLSFS